MVTETTDAWWNWLLLAPEAVEVFAITLPALGLLLAVALLVFPRLWNLRIGNPGIPSFAKPHVQKGAVEPLLGSSEAESPSQEMALHPV